MATTFGKPTKASISARDLGGVSAPYTTMIGSLTCCAALMVFQVTPVMRCAQSVTLVPARVIRPS